MSGVGWGPPHPPPEPLIPVAAPAERTPHEGSGGGRTGTPTRSTGHTVALISAAAFAALVLVLLAAVATGLPSSSSRHPQRIARSTPGSRTPSTERTSGTRPGSLTVRSSLAAVNGIVAQTGRGRQKVIEAIDAVQACSMNPSAAQATVIQVVGERQQSLAQLRRLDGSTPAVGTEQKAIQSLVAVLGDSIQADQDYAAWMGDVAAGQPTCHSDPMNDANFAAGQAFSAQADTDKQVFVEAWNPLAAPAGLTTHQAQDF